MRRTSGSTLWFVVLISLLGCGEGHKQDDTGQPVDTTPPDCAEGTVADGQDCVPEACGVGTWGDLPVDDATIFVDASAAVDGDGSEDAPYTSIQVGLDAAGVAGGGLVAVAAGTYGETLSVTSDHADVSLAGRCADLVVLDASVGAEGDTGLLIEAGASVFVVSGIDVHAANFVGVFVLSGDVTLRDLKITDNIYSGLYVSSNNIGSSTSLLAEDCEISGNFVAGAHFEKTRTDATLRRVAVHDSQYSSWGLEGVGVSAVEGASLRIESSEISGNRSQGLLFFDNYTTVEVVDTLIHGTLAGSTGLFGQGIQAAEGTTLTVDNCEIVENTHAGITVGEEGAQALITNTVIRDTQPTDDGQHGSCLEVGHGASVTMQGCELSDFRIFGVGINGEGTQVRIESTTIRDAIGSDAVPSGLGVYVIEQATAEIDDCTITNVSGMGIAALQSGTNAVVTDTVITGTRPVGIEGQYGIGLAAGIGASLQASGCDVLDSGTMGVLVSDSGSVMVLDDVLISGTQRGMAYTVGVGAAVVGGGELSADGLIISGCEGPGLYAMSSGTQISCEGCVIEQTRFAGVVAEESGAVILAGSEIIDTESDSNAGGGVGIWASADEGETTSLVLTDSLVSGNPVGGVWLSGPGSYQLQNNQLHGGEGEVRGSLVRCGDAVYARGGVPTWDGEQGLYLEGNSLSDGHGAGLFLDGASATLAGNDWSANTVDVITQGSACAEPPPGLDSEPVGTTELCPAWDYSVCGDEFELYLELNAPEGY